MTRTIARTACCSLLILGFFAATAMADDWSYTLTVKAGGQDRTDSPVCVLLEVGQQVSTSEPAVLDGARSVTLTDAKGNAIPAQLTEPGLKNAHANRPGNAAKELHFILPSLKKGKSLKLTAIVSTEPKASDGFVWGPKQADHVELSYRSRPVLRYMCPTLDESSPERRTETYKVFHHLYDPAGTRFITKGHGGKYTHHRGIFFGFNRISYGDDIKVDTWHCKGDTHLSHQGFLGDEAGSVLGRHTVAVDWHGEGKKVFAKEVREMTVYNLPGGQMVEFATRLESTVGPVMLDGDPQHAGFQFRAAQEVADGDQNLTYYLRPDGKGEPGDTRNWSPKDESGLSVNLPWNAMCFVVDGKRYTAVYLDRPDNPKEARYSERTYGRFGCYFEYPLDTDNPLELNYRIWVQEGEMTVDGAAALDADFVKPVGLSPR